jgi:hypothetical protein
MAVKRGLTFREEHRLRVFENRVLRRVSGPKRDEVRENGEKCTVGSFIICTHHQILLGTSSQVEVGGAFGTPWRGKKSIRSFVGKGRRKKATWKTEV